MPFLDELRKLRSLAVVGLAKNTGKTETLNYILRRLADDADHVAVTSIGVDGERKDRVTQTEKPEIFFPCGMTFITSEFHYSHRELTANIMEVSTESTSLGRLVTARTIIPGKVLLSGPASTGGLRRLIARTQRAGLGLTIIDGALSRLSLASPTVTEGMVLATGAAVSTNMRELVRQTKYVYELVMLEPVEEALRERLEDVDQGVWAIGDDGALHDLEIPSVLLMAKAGKDLFRYGHRLYVSGVITDKLLDTLRAQGEEAELVVQDFTKVFASDRSYRNFTARGGRLRCVRRSRLMAVTVNPQSPSGYRLDSDALQGAMREALGIPVYDVRRL